MFTLGGYDFKRFSRTNDTEIDILPYSKNDVHWTVGLPSMKVDSRIQPLSCQTAILDTGTSHIRIPADDFDLIKALLADYS